jgi:hypothetical protein
MIKISFINKMGGAGGIRTNALPNGKPKSKFKQKRLREIDKFSKPIGLFGLFS